MRQNENGMKVVLDESKINRLYEEVLISYKKAVNAFVRPKWCYYFIFSVTD